MRKFLFAGIPNSRSIYNGIIKTFVSAKMKEILLFFYCLLIWNWKKLCLFKKRNATITSSSMPKMTDNLNGTVMNWTCPSSKWRGTKSPFCKIWWSLINYYVFSGNLTSWCSAYHSTENSYLQPPNPANTLTLQNSFCSKCFI